MKHDRILHRANVGTPGTDWVGNINGTPVGGTVETASDGSTVLVLSVPCDHLPVGARFIFEEGSPLPHSGRQGSLTPYYA